MTRRVFSLMAVLSAARRCRLLATVCSLLTFWTGFDSQVLLLASSGSPPRASQNSPPLQEDGDEDDYLLDLTGKPSPGRLWWRSPRPASPSHPPIAVPERWFSLSYQLRQLPTMPVCEHQYRNGIGAPLLC